MFKKIIVTIFIFIFLGIYIGNADDNAGELYSKYILSLRKSDITQDLIKLNQQLQPLLQKTRTEKNISLYKLNNAKLKSIYNKNQVELYLIKKGYAVFFIDSNNKIIVDDGNIFPEYYGDKYVSPKKGYVIEEGKLISTLNSHPDISMKYAIYDKTYKKIYITNSIETKMVANINELNQIFGGITQLQFGIKGDMGRYFLGNNNGRNYLYKIIKTATLNDKFYTFYNNSLDISGESIKNLGFYYNKVNNTYFIGVTEKKDIGDSTIYANIGNADEILYIVASNIHWGNSFDLNTFTQIKNTTDNLTKGLKSVDEKVKVIYDYIINNVEYDYDTLERDKSLSDMSKVSSIEPYSGFGAYKNKKAVCNGYVELLYVMLSFAGINDVEKIDGRVTTSQSIGQNHTWLRVGNKYYDPTFDDGLKDRKYYGISKDVMLGDRVVGFNVNPLPLDQVFSNYVKLSSKYNDEILKGYKILNDLGITKKSDLNTENLKKKLGYMSNSEITSGSRIYVLNNPTPDYYLMLVLQLGSDFGKGKIGTTDSGQVSFIVKI